MFNYSQIIVAELILKSFIYQKDIDFYNVSNSVTITRPHLMCFIQSDDSGEGWGGVGGGSWGEEKGAWTGPEELMCQPPRGGGTTSVRDLTPVTFHPVESTCQTLHHHQHRQPGSSIVWGTQVEERSDQATSWREPGLAFLTRLLFQGGGEGHPNNGEGNEKEDVDAVWTKCCLAQKTNTQWEKWAEKLKKNKKKTNTFLKMRIPLNLQNEQAHTQQESPQPPGAAHLVAHKTLWTNRKKAA